MFVRIRLAVIASGVEAATIRQWVHRGKVVTVHDSGIVLYDLPGVMQTEAATRKRRRNLTKVA